MPLLGRTPWSNLMLGGAYHRNGILLAPLCASLIADALGGTINTADAQLMEHFAWDRFLGENLGDLDDRVAESREPGTPAPAPAAPASATTSPPPKAAAKWTADTVEDAPPAYFDPDADVGVGVAYASRKNREFIKRLEADEVHSPMMDDSKLGEFSAEDEADLLSGSDSPDPNTPTIFRVHDDGTREPIYPGRPPKEMLEGYGDTTLPPPMPEELKPEATPMEPRAEEIAESPEESAEDALNSVDGYAEISADKRARAETIGAAFAQNRKLEEMLDEGGAGKDGYESAMEAAVAADLAEFMRSDGEEVPMN